MNQRIAFIIRRFGGGVSEHRKRSEFKPENGFRMPLPGMCENTFHIVRNLINIYGGLIRFKTGARSLKDR